MGVHDAAVCSFFAGPQMSQSQNIRKHLSLSLHPFIKSTHTYPSYIKHIGTQKYPYIIKMVFTIV
jgi:hypothetical protein